MLTTKCSQKEFGQIGGVRPIELLTFEDGPPRVLRTVLMKTPNEKGRANSNPAFDGFDDYKI